MSKLNGVDISGWDYGINTSVLSADFVIVKSTEGVLGTIYNPTYRDMLEGAKKSGKLIGLYHYANGGDPIAEADCFIKSAQGYEGRLIFCLDWEGQGNKAFETGIDVDWCLKFLDYVAAKTHSTPLLYTSKSVCNEFDWSCVAKKYPIWGAEYGDEKNHLGYLTDPWESKAKWGAWGKPPAIHQWGYVNPTPNNGGISSGLDGDLMYGDRDLWHKWCGAGWTPAEPDTPSVRPKKYVSVADIAALIHYDMVMDDRNGYSQDPRHGGDSPYGFKTLTIYGRNYTYALGSYDCSSSAITAWQLALKYTEYEGALNGATYTGDMKWYFTRSGLFSASLTYAKRGDLYLAEQKHTAMCQDGGNDGVFGFDCLSEFNRNEYHAATGGKPGDQDGYEAVFRGYYNDGWNTVLHYVGNILLEDISESSAADKSSNDITKEGDEMVCFITPDGSGTTHYYDGVFLHALSCPAEKDAINKVYSELHAGANVPHIKLGDKESPYAARFLDAINRGPNFESMNTFTKSDRSMEGRILKAISDVKKSLPAEVDEDALAKKIVELINA